MREQAIASLQALTEVVERLRAPGGCPWDREQTHRTLRPYLLEEAYEVLDAIDSRSDETLKEELGDLLLQVLMHSVIAQEEDVFDIGDVAEVTRAKMIHRHPHVFGDTVVSGAAEVVVNWEKLKRTEKRSRISLLDGVPHALPALAYAHGIQKRPARVGFDETPSADSALRRVQEALDGVAARATVAASRRQGEDWGRDGAAPTELDGPSSDERHSLAAPSADEDAVGELLFAAVALARQLRVNPEEALRRRAVVFADQFRALEARAREEGVDLHDLDDMQWQQRWTAAAPAD